MIKLKKLIFQSDINFNNKTQLDEGLKDYLASLGLAASIFLSAPEAEAQVSKNLTSRSKINKSQIINSMADEIAKYVAENEGVEPRAYFDTKNKLTIGIGHLITNKDREIFSSLFGKNFNYDKMLVGQLELNSAQIEKLFQYDLNRKLVLIKKLFPQYQSYNIHIKKAIVDGVFRGDLSGSPKTIKLINQGLWGDASKEYLNNQEYKKAVKSGSGVAKRMNNNSKVYQWMQSIVDWEKQTGKKFNI